MVPVLHVRLLGEVTVTVDDESVDELRSGRARLLLAYLVLHARSSQLRQRVAFQFWPDSTEAQARTNLRNLLHALRHAHPRIDESLEVTSTTLLWRPSGPVAVDVERFTAAASDALATDPDDPEQLIAACRAAAELYGGDLLAGDDDEWVLPLRGQLRELYRRLLVALCAALIDHNRAAEAAAFARALIAVDPLDEASHRLRIEAHHASGDRAGAVRAYHECATTLHRELQIGPDAATTALYESVVEHAAHSRTSAGPTRRATSGLVGRDGEWQVLADAWTAATSGQPCVVLVTGEAGVGKTRLVDEFGSWCAAQGAALAGARCYAHEGDLGYGTVTSWLRSVPIRKDLDRLAAVERNELARLLPELGTPVPTELVDDAGRRHRLFDAAASALAQPERPTVLVADDAQWGDRASQEFIHYLLRRSAGLPLLIVMTARQEDLDGRHPLLGLRDALALLDGIVELPLGRLPRDATGQLGAQLLGSTLSDAAVDRLFAESGGNPLFVVESVRAGWDGSGAPPTMSPRLRAVIDEQFRRLNPVALALAQFVSVVGRPCRADLLAELSGLDGLDGLVLAQGLDELWQRGILREAGADAYAFSHHKLSEAAYDGLSPATRRRHHGAVADRLAGALAVRGGQEPGVVSAEVARHYEAANRTMEAVTWLHRAALDAQAMYADGEALALLDRALALVGSLPTEMRHVTELELLSSLPNSLAGVDGFASARMTDAHRRATAVATDLGVELSPSVVRSMVMAAACRDEFASACESAEQLLLTARTPALRIEATYLLGITTFWSADFLTARAHFAKVVEEFDDASRLGHVAAFGQDPAVVCLSRLANTQFFLGEPEARSTCERAIALAEEVRHPFSWEATMVFAVLLALDLDDHELLRLAAGKLLDQGRPGRPVATHKDVFTGLVEVLEGEHLAGAALARDALARSGGSNPYPGFQAAVSRVVVATHEIAGDAPGGLEVCTGALAIGGSPVWDPEFHRARAHFLHQLGSRPAAVRDALDAAERIAAGHGSTGQLRRIAAARRVIDGGAEGGNRRNG